MKRILIITLAISSLTHNAYAELHQCDGTWTNKPCEGKIAESIKETSGRVRTAEEVELSQKELWLHDLEMGRLKARKEFGVKVSTLEAQTICNEKTTSLIDCRKAISAREDEIEKGVQAEKDRILKRKEIEERNKAELAAREANKVVVIQNNVEVRPRRHRDWNDSRPGSGTPPRFIPDPNDPFAAPTVPPGSPTVLIDRKKRPSEDSGRDRKASKVEIEEQN